MTPAATATLMICYGSSSGRRSGRGSSRSRVECACGFSRAPQATQLGMAPSPVIKLVAGGTEAAANVNPQPDRMLTLGPTRVPPATWHFPVRRGQANDGGTGRSRTCIRCAIIAFIVHGAMSPGPPPSTLVSAREPMLPRERQRLSVACAYPRFRKAGAPQPPSMSTSSSRQARLFEP